jgi:hypothetical protein
MACSGIALPLPFYSRRNKQTKEKVTERRETNKEERTNEERMREINK